jgi:cbb3-type cytochrome c oxidase subunit III
VRARLLVLALAAALFTGCGSTGVPEGGDTAAGEGLFKAKCGVCHVLKDAGTAGTTGPNLDAAFARARTKDGFEESTIRSVVRNQIEYPVPPMPSRDELPGGAITDEQADDIATYVASVVSLKTEGPPPAKTTPGGKVDGKAVFASSGCGSCHTLADAGTSGTIGPNLDESKPSVQLAIERVTNGSGAMPPFKGQLSEAEIKAVAEYVASVAGK